ncbi:hypothetical protein [Pedobacter sp. L105]|uniref:hypothetical protein n=1 Tax=Pedobacter sp. L105 TaxID=1641871 RepID=UPI0020B16E79
MAEDYEHMSPYIYALNNPVNNTDPDWMSVDDRPVRVENDYHFDPNGQLNEVIFKPGPDRFYQTDGNGQTSELSSSQLTPGMSAQYLRFSALLPPSEDGIQLQEVGVVGQKPTYKIQPIVMEFPLYAEGSGLLSRIPRLFELGIDIMRGQENLSQLIVYMKGERNQAGSAGGTNNPFKKLKPDPNKPGNVIENRPDGKTVSKRAPEGFKEYWNDKHPDKPI